MECPKCGKAMIVHVLELQDRFVYFWTCACGHNESKTEYK